MANIAKFIAGAYPLAFATSLFGSEVSTLATGYTALSSVNVANGTNLDQLMDISLEATISSSTIAAGANFALWLMPLMEDGTTYGDASVTTTPAAITPGLFVCSTMPLRAAASQTALYGFCRGIELPPTSFKMALQNNSGFTLTACTVNFQTYNFNLNG